MCVWMGKWLHVEWSVWGPLAPYRPLSSCITQMFLSLWLLTTAIILLDLLVESRIHSSITYRKSFRLWSSKATVAQIQIPKPQHTNTFLLWRLYSLCGFTICVAAIVFDMRHLGHRTSQPQTIKICNFPFGINKIPPPCLTISLMSSFSNNLLVLWHRRHTFQRNLLLSRQSRGTPRKFQH